MTRTILITSVLLLALAVAFGAAADADDDHDRALQALERGEVLPLGRILVLAQRAVGAGRVIGIEFDRDDGRYIYELELVTRDGQLIELEMDAATGRILELERGHHGRHGDD